jgi:hypothetical protein
MNRPSACRSALILLCLAAAAFRPARGLPPAGNPGAGTKGFMRPKSCDRRKEIERLLRSGDWAAAEVEASAAIAEELKTHENAFATLVSCHA